MAITICPTLSFDESPMVATFIFERVSFFISDIFTESTERSAPASAPLTVASAVVSSLNVTVIF